jgi:hypothetical protein
VIDDGCAGDDEVERSGHDQIECSMLRSSGGLCLAMLGAPP